MPPDVSECKGAEKGVTQGVDGYIAIRMPRSGFEPLAFRLGVKLSVSYRMVHSTRKYRKILKNQHF